MRSNIGLPRTRHPGDLGTAPPASDRAAVRGPVAGGERALAPDLARGVMLLLIALANTPWYRYDETPGLATIHGQDGSAVDKLTQLMIITAVDARVYPMFAFLFGYGMVQLYLRQLAAGTDEATARRLLRRRNWWLIAFGAVHAGLLWVGDILGAYGLAGLVVGGLFLRRRDNTLLLWAAGLVAALLQAAALVVMGAGAAARFIPDVQVNLLEGALEVTGIASYPDSALTRLAFWPLLVLGQGLLGLVVPAMMLLAFWSARRRILEEPGSHRQLLRRTAAVGLGVGWLGGLPHALDHLGVLPVPDQVAWVFLATQGVTGLFAGLGYVALFGLLGHRLAQGTGRPGPDRRNIALTALAAVGKRSLSCYLAQSVICAPLLSGWGLALGARLGSAGMALFAVGVWLLTVLGAYALERAGRRGPAEVLLRRLVYPAARPAPAPG